MAGCYGIDPDRVGVCGGSAGGHLSAMAATSNGVAKYEGNGGHADFSSDVQLAVLYNGEFDMWDLVEKGSLIDAMNAFFDGPPDKIPAVYDEASPIKRVTKDTPPMLFLHGDQDTCVSHQQALAMVKRPERVEGVGGSRSLQGEAPRLVQQGSGLEDYVQRVEPFLVKHFGLK